MKVETLKDLKKVIQLCRQTGVDILKVDGIELVLGSQPISTQPVKRTNSPADVFNAAMGPDVIETPDALTDEELLFYSAQSQSGEI